MINARVLVHFAEKVLAVDQLQGPTPKRFELDAKAFEFQLLPTNGMARDLSALESG